MTQVESHPYHREHKYDHNDPTRHFVGRILSHVIDTTPKRGGDSCQKPDASANRGVGA